MAYDPSNSSPDNEDYISAIRFLTQDTSTGAPDFSDEEITSQFGFTSEDDTQLVRNLGTASRLYWILHRRYAKQASFSSGKTKMELQERAEYFRTAALDMEADYQGALGAQNGYSGVIYAGRPVSYQDGFL